MARTVTAEAAGKAFRCSISEPSRRFSRWFGGTGYLLERYAAIWVFLALFISVISGVAGAAVVFWFLAKLAAQDRPLDPADYEMVGVLGTVTSPIRAGGTGELMYSTRWLAQGRAGAE